MHPLNPRALIGIAAVLGILAVAGLLAAQPWWASLAHAQDSPSAAVELSEDSVERGTAITATMSFSNLETDSDTATTDYIFRADVVGTDACEGGGMGVDRYFYKVDEDPETRGGTVSADCPAGAYTVRVTLSSADNTELDSATAGFSIAEPAPEQTPEPTQEPPPSDDATLRSLELSGVTLAFDPATTGYTANVANRIAETAVTATVNHEEATYKVKLGGVSQGDGVVPLAVGGNAVTVEVTAEDGENTRTYTVTVTRAAPPSVTIALSPSNSVEEGETITATMSFSDLEADSDTSTTDYIFRADVLNSENEDADSCEGGGMGVDRYFYKVDEDPETRTGSTDAGCPAGAYTLRASVSSADNTELASDSAGFFILSAPVVIEPPTLTALSISHGEPAVDVALSPVFDSGTLEYRADVDVAQVTIAPTASDAGATVAYLDGNGDAIADADAEADGHQVGLGAGSNAVKVAVSKDGLTTTYTVSLFRLVTQQQNSEVTLISNTGKGHAASVQLTSNLVKAAQAFTTGPNTGGYNLTSIAARFSSVPAASSDVEVTIRADSSGSPSGTVFAALTNPGTFTANAIHTFTAPANTVLAASTTYFVHFERKGTTNPGLSYITTGDEDSGGSMGWSIADALVRYRNNAWTTYSSTRVLKIAVVGSAASGSGDTNNAPVFATATATRSVDENTAAGQNVGAVVTATDADNDTLTYTLAGTDAASFAIVGTSGQIQTKAALDYETKTSYTVTVKATDTSSASGTIAVTINVGDVDEPPSAPVAPTVTATSGSSSSLDVTWEAPTNTGRPDITSYDLQYRQGTTGSFTAGPADQTGKSAAITGLTENTSYEVQVRATNDEGDSGWSDSGTGMTSSSTTDAALVSNIGQDAASDFNVGTSDWAQAFTTGTNSGGYNLASIELSTSGRASGSENANLEVSIWSAAAGGTPGAVERTLTTPASWTSGVVAFTPGTALVLSASTTYFVHVHNNPDGAITMNRTSSTDEDSGAAEGWSIGDTRYWRTRDTTGTWSTSTILFKLRVNGTARSGGANNAPVFADNTATRSVDENTAAGQNVGAVVTATDADNDTLTYTLEGTDKASFDIVGTSGQIQTKAALDYETETTYNVTVKVSDGTASATIAVRIDVSDVDEPPSAPGAPTVTATSGSSTSLDVSWSEPTNKGPAITDYDVQYRAGSTGSFTSWSHSGTTRSATITGLNASTGYQVQVRATNPEGTGGWSASGSGRTSGGSNSAPVFAYSTTTRSVAENTAAEQNVGAVVTATDADAGDTLTYTLEGTDAASFAIVSTSGQIQTKAALDYETKSSYYVTVKASDGTASDTIAVAINVSNVNEPGAVSLSPALPQVGTALTATLRDPDGGVTGKTWVWASSIDKSAWTAISGAASASYTPVDGDLNRYLRATASYTDTLGAGRSAAGISANKVAAQGTNSAPVFADATATRSVAENTAADTNISYPVMATDADGDTLTYTLEGTDAASFAIVSTNGRLRTKAALDYETKSSYSVTVKASDGTDSDTIAVSIRVIDVAEGGTVAAGHHSAPGGTIWSAKLTSRYLVVDGEYLRVYGYQKEGSDGNEDQGALSDVDFVIGSDTYTVKGIRQWMETSRGYENDWLTVVLSRELAPADLSALTLHVSGVSFAFSKATDAPAADGGGTVYGWKVDWDGPLNWRTGSSLRFHSGVVHDVHITSSAAGTNARATGRPVITGTARIGETLEVDTSGIADANGLSNAAFKYQWTVIEADGAAGDRRFMSGATVRLSPWIKYRYGHLGKKLQVRVFFTDDAGNVESLLSETTDTIVDQE